MSSTNKIRLFAGSMLLLSAALVWGWVLWPAPYTEKSIDLLSITSTDPRFETIVSQINQSAFRVNLQYPAQLHTGETGNITVRMIQTGNASSSLLQTAGEQAMVEGRVVLPLLQLEPPESIRETFSLENLPRFSWKVKSAVEGGYSGQFWFYLLLVAPDGSMERQALLSVPLSIEENSFLGLPENILIWLAVILTLAGLIIFPIFTLFWSRPSAKPVYSK